MDFRVVRKYFYQKWRGHSLKNHTRREIVFLLLGAPKYALGFGNLLRLSFIRVNSVMNDEAIINLFTDPEMSQFVKFAAVLPNGEVLFDMNLPQVIPTVDTDLSSLVAYLDLPRVFHEVGVDLASAGPDPMSAPEAFFLKLLWPSYIECDEKYVAIVIAGILATRFDTDPSQAMRLPPFAMHLTEVGMHLKSLEAVDASLAWALPSLKNEGLRLARFLGKAGTGRYFSVTDSPCHHSDKVVALNVDLIWKDAARLWSLQDIASYLREGEFLSNMMSRIDGMEAHMAHLTQVCAEAALTEDNDIDLQRFASIDASSSSSMSTRAMEESTQLLTLQRSPTTVRSQRTPKSVFDPTTAGRLVLGDLFNLSDSHSKMGRMPLYFDKAVCYPIAAAPAGVENDLENINFFH